MKKILLFFLCILLLVIPKPVMAKNQANKYHKTLAPRLAFYTEHKDFQAEKPPEHGWTVSWVSEDETQFKVLHPSWGVYQASCISGPNVTVPKVGASCSLVNNFTSFWCGDKIQELGKLIILQQYTPTPKPSPTFTLTMTPTLTPTYIPTGTAAALPQSSKTSIPTQQVIPTRQPPGGGGFTGIWNGIVNFVLKLINSLIS